MQGQYARDLEVQLGERTREIAEQAHHLETQRVRQLELAFEQRLAETEMGALRAQMNPHFIFNCLNSIKLYATENDSAKAAEYLTKFSRLIRLVLENSRSERVTLQNELDALWLYLEMEAMRFKDKLRFSVEVSPDVDADFIEIPPLLIQPYVENAIWHGLMHKTEGGTVALRVEQPADNLLRVTITDDGVGRARAAVLKSKSAAPRKSFGMDVTSERIALINQLYKTHTRVQVHDLTDAAGEPAGTEVVLETTI
jgi:LytS/YehU family sensor histidine kinase